MKRSRENWLSPVFQATWEAIELWVGWRWNGFYYQTCVILWLYYDPPLLGEGQLRRPNSCVIVLKMCQKPNKIIFKEVMKRNFFSDGNSISFIWLR